jgi:hypothetical protein
MFDILTLEVFKKTSNKHDSPCCEEIEYIKKQ